jgi:hypothetical protein
MLAEIPKEIFMEYIPERERNLGDTDFKVFANALGNFTVCILQTKKGMLAAGVSKRNPCDRSNSTGFGVAAVRAWRDYQGKDPGYSRQHPVSRKQAIRIAVDTKVEEILEELDEAFGG